MPRLTGPGTGLVFSSMALLVVRLIGPNPLSLIEHPGSRILRRARKSALQRKARWRGRAPTLRLRLKVPGR